MSMGDDRPIRLCGLDGSDRPISVGMMVLDSEDSFDFGDLTMCGA